MSSAATFWACNVLRGLVSIHRPDISSSSSVYVDSFPARRDVIRAPLSCYRLQRCHSDVLYKLVALAALSVSSLCVPLHQVFQPCSSASLARPGDRISLSNLPALPVVGGSHRLCRRPQDVHPCAVRQACGLPSCPCVSIHAHGPLRQVRRQAVAVLCLPGVVLVAPLWVGSVPVSHAPAAISLSAT